jgi:large subunit ribosomal protein L1
VEERKARHNHERNLEMAKHSKKYTEAIAKVPAEAVAPLEAMKLIKEISFASFDETVTADFRLGLDTRQADQQLRGTVSLPNGSGKTVRVAVFAEGDAARAAEEAGADIVGTDELTEQINRGEFNFDAAVATPDQMAKVGRLGKVLGPRGLMPNPKLGTVTNDVAKAIKELKGGRVEYRADRYGIAHVVLGKVSFTEAQLAENYGAVYDEILRMKPAAAKGKYVKSITVSATMTPGVSVDGGVQRNYTEAE